MKLYRYCGQEEITRLMNGEVLENNTDWSAIRDTTSKGFCFFAYNRTNDMSKVVTCSLEDWLGGIVNDEYIVEIEVEKAKKSKGFYASGYHAEYNLSSYSIKNVKAISKVIKLNPADYIVVGDYDYIYTYTVEKIF